MTIYSLQTPDQEVTFLSYWKNVPFVAGREFIEFTPGLNIVFGPNGSGKTTLIKTLALALHTFQGGFQKVTQDSISQMFNTPIKLGRNIEDDERTFGEKIQRAITDDEEVRFVAADQNVGFYAGTFDDDFFRDDVSLRMAHGSSGQKSLQKVNRVIVAKSLPKGKSIFGIERAHVNTLWQNRIDVVAKLLKPQPRKGVPSVPALIFDEPDRSMDFKYQWELWDMLGKTINCQVIVASHSPFAMNIPGANYIETVPNALRDLKEVLRKGGWEYVSDKQTTSGKQVGSGRPPKKTLEDLRKKPK